MTMTRLEMQGHVQVNIGNRSDLNTQIIDYLDWAVRDAASVRNWRDDMIVDDKGSISTVEGTKTYPLPSNTKDIISTVYYDDSISTSYSLRYMPPEHFDARHPNPEKDGNNRPQIFTRRGNDIELMPIPAITGVPIFMRLAIWPDEMTADDDVCPLANLDYAIVFGATAYAMRAINDKGRGAEFENEFKKAMRRAARAENEPSAWTPQYASVRLRQNIPSGDLIVDPEYA